MNRTVCDGLCVTVDDIGLAGDIGLPGHEVAYPHPGCPEHAPNAVCECGAPDKCLSPTHGQIDMSEALKIRYRQNPRDPRAEQ